MGGVAQILGQAWLSPHTCPAVPGPSMAAESSFRDREKGVGSRGSANSAQSSRSLDVGVRTCTEPSERRTRQRSFRFKAVRTITEQ